MKKITYYLKQFFDVKFLKFLLVGGANTLLGLVLMFLLYNLAHLGYWGSSALSFILASIFSYFVNKGFTFSYGGGNSLVFLRFAAVICLSYLIGFYISKNAVLFITDRFFDNLPIKYSEQIAMLFGNGIFSVLNYLGQRNFAFKKTEEDK